MRRFACLLLAMLLLLGGCAKPNEETPASSVPSFSVKTDYSAYAPPESTPPITTYIGVSDLQAGDGYGSLYPFVGQVLSPDYYAAPLYGLMDAQGKIVVDPVYYGVQLLEHEGEAVWCLTKCIFNEDDYYSYYYLHTLATFDGTVVVEKNYHSASFEDGYIIAGYEDENDVTAYDIYNLNLDLVTTSEKLCSPFPDIPGELWRISFADGMFRLDFYQNDGESLCYYTSPDGSHLLGPYESGENFAYGYAAVYDGEEEYYIDKDGKPLGEKPYSPYWDEHCFENGVAHVFTHDYDQFGAIVDTRGNTVLDCEIRSSFQITDHGIALMLSDLKITGWYSFEGELLFPDYFPYAEDGSEEYAGYFPQGWAYLGEGIFFDWNTGTLHNYSTGNTYRSPLLTSGDVESYFAEGLPYLHVKLYNDWGYSNLVLSKEFEELLRVDESYLYLKKDLITQEQYFVLEEENSIQVYDKDLKLLLDLSGEKNLDLIGIYNGHIVCLEGDFGTCYTTDGTQVFRYALQTNLD